MKIYYVMLVALLVAACQPQETTNAEAAEMQEVAETPSIEGAWELTSRTNNDGEVSEPYKSIIIYSDGFYSIEIAWENIPSWEELAEGEERAAEDILNSYNRLTSNSGRYEIQGDSIIHEAIVAKHPNFMNDWPRGASAYSLDGDNLTTTGNRGSYNYKRIR